MGNEYLQYIRIGISFFRMMQVAYHRPRLKAEGYDPVTVAAVVEAIRGGRSFEAIVHIADQRRAQILKQAILKKTPPPVHGSARFATKKEMIEAGLFKQKAGDCIYLGLNGHNPIMWAGESHLLTIAPTRTGKSTMQIVPNLLQYKGSAVVLDPKGELLEQTGDWRKRHVGPVYVIDPFNQVKDQLTHSFNPLDFVETPQDATKLAEMIYPRAEDDKQRFFDNEAIGFLAGVIEFTARYAPKDRRTFGTIRDTISSLSSDFYGLLDAMSNDVMPPSIRNAALTVKTKTYDTGKPRLIDSVSQHMRIWDTEGLRTATQTSDFDFKDLKEKPATVYLVLPFEEIKPYSVYVKLMMAAALDAMLANKSQPDIPVLFVLDEFLSLDHDERFTDALRTHASAGVRLWFFLQDLPTLEQKYPTTWRSFFQAELITFFGTDDPFTAELVSKYLGDQTVAYETPSMNSGNSGSGGSYGLSDNLHLTARKLYTPDELINHMGQVSSTGERVGVHFMRGIRPIVATMSPWFNEDVFRIRAGTDETPATVQHTPAPPAQPATEQPLAHEV